MDLLSTGCNLSLKLAYVAIGTTRKHVVKHVTKVLCPKNKFLEIYTLYRSMSSIKI